jgi:hypothetical protein
MDLCSSLRPGENFWFQLILVPIDFKWTTDLDKEVSKILGEKPKFKKNILHYANDAALGLITGASDAILGGTPTEKKEEKKDDSLKMMNLKPKQKKRVEAIEKKSGKVGFATKIRVVYVAEKEVFSKAKVFSGFVGFIKQFAALDLNNLKPDMSLTMTSTAYFFRKKHIDSKKNKIFHNFITRDSYAGRKRGLMTTDELATIWHFPSETMVKAPLIQKAPGRKAEPPMSLPQADESVGVEKSEPLFFGGMEDELENTDGFDKTDLSSVVVEDEKSSAVEELMGKEDNFADKKGAPPENLPFV